MTWRRIPLKYLCADSGQYGLNIPADHYSSGGVRLIRTSDIDGDGKLKSAGGAVYVSIPLERRHVLKPGDLLLSRSGTLGRSLLVPELPEPATFAGYLVRFRPGPEVESRFLSYAARSRPFQGRVRAEAVASTIQNFNAERYANVPVDIPDLEEQRRIADFLDAEVARIDRLERFLARQLELLEERYTAMIDCVLGRAAEAVIPLGYLATVVDTGHRTAPNVDGGGYWIVGTSAVRRGRIRHEEMYETDINSYRDWTRRKTPRHGDVLLSREAPVGEVAVYRPEDPAIAIGQRMVLVSPIPEKITSDFLLWSLLATRSRKFIFEVAQGSLHPHLNMSDIGSIPVAWGPLDRQREIVREIADLVDENERLVGLRRRQGAVLAERRESLVTCAVTGQVDVPTASGRGVAV